MPRNLRLASLLLLFACPTAGTRLMAQADEALLAIRVRDFIMLDYAKGTRTLRFATDAGTPRERFHSFNGDQLFAVTNGRKVNVSIRFLNPLRYSWASSQSSAEDPLVESVRKFLATADVLLGLISSAPATTAVPAPAVVTPGGVKDAEPSPSRGSQERANDFLDPTLLEWGLWTDSFAWKAQGDSIALASARRNAHQLDAMLSGELRGGKPGTVLTAADFRAATVQPLRSLIDAGSVATLRSATDSLRVSIDRLTAANVAVREAGRALRQDAEALSNLVVDSIPKNRRDTLLIYSRRALSSAAQRAIPTIESRELLVREMADVLAGLQTLLQNTTDDALGFHVAEVSTRSGQRSTVTVMITERKVEVSATGVSSTDVSSSSVKFGVLERQTLVPELTQGLAFSNLAYPEFRTNESPSGPIVADAGDQRPRAVAIAMLNLIPNVGWSGFTRTVGQIGIGATTDSPVLLAGGGIRFTQPTRFIVTAGVAFPFVKQLKTLQVGDAVAGEAALRTDVERRLGRPAVYIGIQR